VKTLTIFAKNQPETFMQDNAFYLSELRGQLLTACGIEKPNLDHCREISIQIFNKDRNYLSQSTIQHFLGLTKVTGTPSPFVLDSLARFTGHGSWDQFKNKLIEKEIPRIPKISR